MFFGRLGNDSAHTHETYPGCFGASNILWMVRTLDARHVKPPDAHGVTSLVLFIAPPSGVVFFQFLAGFTVVLGLALGWAWGVIAMKAALATRPAADLQARYKLLQESAPKNTTYPTQASGQGTYLQVQIYNGFMLDTRVSVTYFCMVCLFIYLVVCSS
jgi:hypothetical protein